MSGGGGGGGDYSLDMGAYFLHGTVRFRFFFRERRGVDDVERSQSIGGGIGLLQMTPLKVRFCFFF